MKLQLAMIFKIPKGASYNGIVRMCGIRSFKLLLIQLLYLIQSHLDYIKLAICLAFTLECLPDAEFVYRQFICRHSLNNRLACWGLSLMEKCTWKDRIMHSKQQLPVQKGGKHIEYFVSSTLLHKLCPFINFCNLCDEEA